MMGHTDTLLSKRVFFTNLVSNIGFFCANALISLWFVSYLIHNLGVAVYGLIPLVLTITSYFNLFTFGLNMAVGRFMTIAFECPNPKDVNRIFNSSFLASIAIAIILLPLGVLLYLFAVRWLNIPHGFEQQVSLLFTFMILALIVTTIGSSFNIISYCRNRFDLANLGNVLGLILKVSLVVLLFKFYTPNLWQVGVGIAGDSIITFIVGVYVCRYLFPKVRVNFKDFSFQILKKISKTGSWIFISQIGTILLTSIDLLVVNKLFGAEESGYYASVLLWSMLLRSLALVVAGIFGPTIIAYYAKGQIDGLVGYSKRAVKFMGLLIALPVGLICGFSRPLLHLWLGTGFENLAFLMLILTGHLALNLSYLPLHHVSMATNNVKWPAISQIIAGSFNLVLAIILGKMLGLWGVALAGAVVLLIRNLVFTPLYAAHIIKKPLNVFNNEVFPIMIQTIFVGGISWLISSVWVVNSWMKLILFSIPVVLFYGLFSWCFILKLQERKFATTMLVKIFTRLPITE